MKLTSKKYLKKPEWSSIRALYKGMGYSDYDLDNMLIGVANSWNRATPGHFNFNQIAEYVCQGIYQAGGTPVEFGIIGPCDGMACGTDGMRYILPSREIIANEVEIMANVNHLDGIVLLGSCDKVIPGLLMAAARIDIPAIIVNAGPALGGPEFDGRSSDNSSMVEALCMLQNNEITQEEYDYLEDNSNPSCGSCSFLGTANTMCAVTEALGMSLPGSSTVPAVMSERFRVAQESGRRIVKMVHENLSARKIITKEGLVNATRLGMAIGGSTNLALHIPAIAYEAEVDFGIDEIAEVADSTPHIAKVYPNGPQNVIDFHYAGGVILTMKHLENQLNLDAITCKGVTWKEVLDTVDKVENSIIHSVDNAWHKSGSLAVLRGNLAPNTAITKPTAIDNSMLYFRGEAICFDSEEEATEAVMNNRIKEGMVLVIRYEGPKGGPGMREMVRILKLLYGKNLALSTAVITDGRFSGSNNGCFVGHVSPEAIEGGPIALVEDGDIISIDIENRNINLEVSDEELSLRKEKWESLFNERNQAGKIKGYLNVYSRLAESADQGAIIKYN